MQDRLLGLREDCRYSFERLADPGRRIYKRLSDLARLPQVARRVLWLCTRGGGEHPENYLANTPHRSYLVNKPLCVLRMYKHSAQRNHRHISRSI